MEISLQMGIRTAGKKPIQERRRHCEGVKKKGCPLKAAFFNKMNFLEVEVQVDRSTAVISIDTKR